MSDSNWTESEEIFERWLYELEEGEPESFSAVLARHPEHRERLKQLQDHWRRLRIVREHVVEGAPQNADSSGQIDADFRGPRSLGDQANVVAPGARVGRYQLVREVGRGGMGVVWEARDLVLAEGVALKFLPQVLGTDRVAMLRMRREARVLLSLTHERIVRLRNIESNGGLTFLVEELLDGPDLQDVFAQRVCAGGQGLSPEEAQWVLEQVAPALDHAHASGVTHRDIKPSNLLLDRAPEQGIDARLGARGEQLKVADFGLAFVATSALSRVSSYKPSGTLPYMAPEVLAGRKPSPAADVYGLGATLYALVTGDPPFQHGDIAMQVLHRDPEPLDSGDANLDQAVMAALRKDPSLRPASVGELLELARGARVSTPLPSTGAWRRVAFAVVALAALAAGVLFGLRFFDAGSESQNTDAAGDVEPPSDSKTDASVLADREVREVRFRAPFDAEVVHVAGGVPLELSGALLNSERAELEVTVDSSADTLTTDASGAFRYPIPPLSAGEHAVRVLDRGELVRAVRVVVDAQVPILSLLAPSEAEITTARAAVDVVLAAKDEYLAQVRYQDTPLELTPEGDWRAAAVPLQPGPNELVFEAVDHAGNVASLSLAVLRETRVPALVTQVPADGSSVDLLRPSPIELHFDTPLSALSLDGSPLELSPDRLIARGTWQPSTDGSVEVSWQAESEHGLAFTGSLAVHVRPFGVAPVIDGTAFDVLDDEAGWDGWARHVRDPRTGVEFRLVDPGATRVGVPPYAAPSIAGPWFEARLTRPFYLATTELTVGQFGPFVKETGYLTDAERRGNGLVGAIEKPGVSWIDPLSSGAEVEQERAVTQVSWFDANAYCHHFGFRLPSEIEWEVAARAGRGAHWWKADEPGFAQELSQATFGLPPAMAERLPAAGEVENPLGLRGMLGGVWEWCADGFDPFAYRGFVDWRQEYGFEEVEPRPVLDPRRSPVEPSHPRVLRGGSFAAVREVLCVATRGWGFPSVSSSTRGFRPALDPAGIERAPVVASEFLRPDPVELMCGDQLVALRWERDSEGMPRLEGDYSMQRADGLRESGTFVGGRREGRWKLENADGGRLILGTYAMDLPARAWRYERDDGRELILSFRAGLPNGRFERSEPGDAPSVEGRKSIAFRKTADALGALVDGRREGPWVEFWSNGVLRLEGRYESGRLSGPVQAFAPDGAPLGRFLSGHFVDGRRALVQGAPWQPAAEIWRPPAGHPIKSTQAPWALEPSSRELIDALLAIEAPAAGVDAELPDAFFAAAVDDILSTSAHLEPPLLLEAVVALRIDQMEAVRLGEALLARFARRCGGRRPEWRLGISAADRTWNAEVQAELWALALTAESRPGFWQIDAKGPLDVIAGSTDADVSSSRFMLEPVFDDPPDLGGARWLKRSRSGAARAREAERTIDAALAWLAAHQRGDGAWDPAHFMVRCEECDAAGHSSHVVGLTGLAATAFLRSATEQRLAQHGDRLRAALGWILSQQDVSSGRIGPEDVANPRTTDRPTRDHGIEWRPPEVVECSGCGGSGIRADLGVERICETCNGSGIIEGPPRPRRRETPAVEPELQAGLMSSPPIVDHALATIALAEGYAWTGSRALFQALEGAVAWLERARNPYNAWRYSIPPVGDNDTHSTTWVLLALVAAQDVGVDVSQEAFAGGLQFLAEVSDPGSGRIGYQKMGSTSSRSVPNQDYPAEKAETMTAAGLLAKRLLFEWPTTGAVFEQHTKLLLRKIPEWDPEGFGCDLLYWFFGAEALQRHPVQKGELWLRSLARVLVDSQRKDGHALGSWDPVGPWGFVGGRVYSTALNVLSLTALE